MTLTAILGTIYKVAPAVASVAKRNHAILEQRSVFTLSHDERFRLSAQIQSSLLLIASLQNATDSDPSKLDEFFGSDDCQDFLRRLFGLQWRLLPPDDQRLSKKVQDDLARMGIGADRKESRELYLKRQATRELDAESRALFTQRLRRALIENEVISDGPELDEMVSAVLTISIVTTAYVWDHVRTSDFLTQDSAFASANSRLLPDELDALRKELTEQVTLAPKDYRAFLQYLYSPQERSAL